MEEVDYQEKTTAVRAFGHLRPSTVHELLLFICAIFLPNFPYEFLSGLLLVVLVPGDADRDDDDDDDDEGDAGDTAGNDVDHQVVLKHLAKKMFKMGNK